MALYRSYSRVSIPRSPSAVALSPQAPSVEETKQRLRQTSLSSAELFPLGRSTSTVFSSRPKSSRTSMATTNLMTTTPYFTDRYPHVRYGHGVAADTAYQNALIMAQPHRDHYSQRDRSTRSYLDTTLNMYSSQLRALPAYGKTPRPSYGSLPKPKFTTRDYVRYMPIDSAVDMFKNRYMTSSTLSKYWLSSYDRGMNRPSTTFTLTRSPQSSYPGTVRYYTPVSGQTRRYHY